MSTLKHVTAAILAGGLGTRLRAVVPDRPKVLATVNGRPFLSFLLDMLQSAGVEKTVLCSGYLAEQLEAEYGQAHENMRLEYSPESEPLGTAGALRAALPRFDSDTVLVLNGDSFCGVDLDALHSFHVANRADVSLTLTEVKDAGRFGTIACHPSGRVRRFAEKQAGPGQGLVNAGIYLFAHEVLAGIPAGRFVSLERDTIPALLIPGMLGRRVFGYPAGQPLLDIGTPESYARAAAFFGAAA